MTRCGSGVDRYTDRLTWIRFELSLRLQIGRLWSGGCGWLWSSRAEIVGSRPDCYGRTQAHGRRRSGELRRSRARGSIPCTNGTGAKGTTHLIDLGHKDGRSGNSGVERLARRSARRGVGVGLRVWLGWLLEEGDDGQVPPVTKSERGGGNAGQHWAESQLGSELQGMGDPSCGLQGARMDFRCWTGLKSELPSSEVSCDLSWESEGIFQTSVAGLTQAEKEKDFVLFCFFLFWKIQTNEFKYYFEFNQRKIMQQHVCNKPHAIYLFT
jgi:hypothetical protein